MRRKIGLQDGFSNLDLSAFGKLVLHFCPWARPPGGDIVKAFLKFAV